jgi:predicted site-specific integrase-resolvase
MLFGALGYLFILRPQTPMWEYGTGKGEPSIMPAPAPRLPFSTEDVSVKTAESVSVHGEERKTQYVQTQGRAMVYEADMVIEVGEGQVQDAARKVMNVATSFNGYVSYSWIEEKRAVVSIRVPADKLNLAMDAVRNLGKVKSENLNAYDVTDQLVDIEARLNNSKATERRLLEILSMAKDVNDVLMVEDRLKWVREEVEMLEAQLKNLKSSIDYSTLTVTIEEKKGLELPEFNFSRLLNMALTAFYAAITLIVVGAFLATPLGAVGLVGLWIYRRIRTSKVRAGISP